jgi:hypothetical protein
MTLPIGPFEAREEKQHGPQRLSCDKFVTCARKIPVPPITSSCRNFARIRFAGVVLRTADAVTGAIMNCARAIAFSAVMASGALIISSTEGARAAPVEYVRICNLYGDGFFYIPGTDTCIKVSSGFAGGFNGTSVGSARFISTDTLAAIPTRTLGVDSSNTNAAIGYLSTTYFPLSAPRPTAQSGAVWVFVRSGGVWEQKGTPSDPVSFPGTFPQGTGFVKDPPTSTIPLLGGLSIPASWLGLGWPALSFEIMGGVDFNRRSASINLVEPGAGPGGQPVIASKSWTSSDPAFGVGFQYALGRFAGMPTSFGTTVIFDWSSAQTVHAQSPNFPSQSYTLSTGSQRDTLVLFSLNMDFFAPPPAAPAMPMRARHK